MKGTLKLKTKIKKSSIWNDLEQIEIKKLMKQYEIDRG